VLYGIGVWLINVVVEENFKNFVSDAGIADFIFNPRIYYAFMKSV
jgi:hypothetical protein